MKLEPYDIQKINERASLSVSNELAKIFLKRRTIRNFSKYKPPVKVIENAINVARMAPSGANKQPWSFALISNDETKKEIRESAEKEEHIFYHEKPNKNWLQDLKKIGTNDRKKFLTDCPYLIAVFYKNHNVNNGVKTGKNYYSKESVGIATGMLLSALHMSGLSVLTYTPTNKQFLKKILNRPDEERAFMLLAVGMPNEGAQIPVLTKKSIDDVLTTYY